MEYIQKLIEECNLVEDPKGKIVLNGKRYTANNPGPECLEQLYITSGHINALLKDLDKIKRLLENLQLLWLKVDVPVEVKAYLAYLPKLNKLMEEIGEEIKHLENIRQEILELFGKLI